MDPREPKSNRKRQCKHDDNGPRLAQRKSQRLIAKTSSSPSSTKITNLNDDCLLKIFERLDVRSLFNVAVANEYLRPAAGIVYKRKLDNKTVVIKNIRDYPISEPFVDGNQVHITNLKLILQYLRCLGSSISNLCVYYHGWNEEQCDHIHQYLNQYCANSLISIQFRGTSAGKPLTQIEKPFVNVRTVAVHNSDLGAQFTSFSKCFPNLRSLTLNYARIHAQCSVDMPFPHLEELRIELSNLEHDVAQNFTTRLLQQCPQLHSLFIRTIDGKEVNLEAMLKITEGCRSIRNLEVSMVPQKIPVTLSDVQKLVNAHPSLVQLQLYGYEFSVPVVRTITRQLNSLEQFKFQFANYSKYNQFVSRLDSHWRPSLDEEPCEGLVIKLEL